MDDPMFAPENLRRLAQQQWKEEQEARRKAAQINLSASFDLDEKLVVPFSFSTRPLNCDLEVSGELQLKFVTSSDDFDQVYKLPSRAERIAKLRDVIKLEATLVQMTFT